MSDEIDAFKIAAPDADLEDLKHRLRATRWPERECVDDWSQGTACWERGGFEPPSPFRLWAAENSASSAHYFAKLLRNLSQRIYSPSVRHLSNLTGSPQWR
jgi:hypothetical protein